jgi:gamma-glutamylcyclotransferase
MLYFAYGSNMCTARLRARVPSARPIAAACLENHRFAFHKISDDDSGKGDAFYTGEPADFVWGVVFDIDEGEKPRLDRHEGLGFGYTGDGSHRAGVER